METTTQPKYEVKVWQRGAQDWCWEVRKGPRPGARYVSHGFRETSRQKATETARNAARNAEAAANARWKSLDF